MNDNIALITTISLIIIFSPFFAKFLKLPTTPIEIILGSVLGYAGFIHSEHLLTSLPNWDFCILCLLQVLRLISKMFYKPPQQL